MGTILNTPAFRNTEIFPRGRLKIEIYTDACEKSPFEKETINCDSGIGIGGILAISGKVVEFHTLEVNERIPPRLKGLKPPHRLISFFELLSTYIGLRLRTPNRQENNDL